MKPKLRLQTVPCKRGCGVMVTTLNRPIHASPATYQKWSGICADCMTPEEREQVTIDIDSDVAARFGGSR